MLFQKTLLPQDKCLNHKHFVPKTNFVQDKNNVVPDKISFVPENSFPSTIVPVSSAIAKLTFITKLHF